jgi:hypothetical protein
MLFTPHPIRLNSCIIANIGIRLFLSRYNFALSSHHSFRLFSYHRQHRIPTTTSPSTVPAIDRIKPSCSPIRPDAAPRLIVRHPHYKDFNLLVSLPALNADQTVDYNVTLIVCGIICDNSWSTGWFSHSREGNDPCPQGQPLTVAHDVYYFVDDRSCMLSSLSFNT